MSSENPELEDFREFIGISALACFSFVATFAMMGYRSYLGIRMAAVVVGIMAFLGLMHVRLWWKLGRYTTETEQSEEADRDV